MSCDSEMSVGDPWRESPDAPPLGADWSRVIRYVEANVAGWSRRSGLPDQARTAIRSIVAESMAEYMGDGSSASVVENIADTLNSVLDLMARVPIRQVDHEAGALEDLTAALVGREAAVLARDCGVVIARSYSAIALSIPSDTGDAGRAERAVPGIRGELRRRDSRALCQLSPSGGTILVPVRRGVEDSAQDELLTDLSAAARVELTGAVITAPSSQIPDAVARAHELLDVALALDRTGRLHRPGDLALEWQLLRPGPGREVLAAVADTLEQRPDLMETLRLYVYAGFDRSRIGRMLHVHPNTVDYRLKTVARLTGYDPTQSAGMWYLRSALTVWMAEANRAAVR